MVSGHNHLGERLMAAAAALAEAPDRDALVAAAAELQEALANALASASISAAELSLARARRGNSSNGHHQEPFPGMEEAAGPAQTALAEALLFVAPEPLDVATLSRLLELSEVDTLVVLERLSRELSGRGIRLQQSGDRLQLISAPDAAPLVERLLGIQAGTTRLSSAALETLAIIAYRQPMTRAQIEAVRGVDSSATVRALLARGLIAEAGRAETVGRPILYVTTPDFLSQFGLQSLADLPPLELPEPGV